MIRWLRNLFALYAADRSHRLPARYEDLCM